MITAQSTLSLIELMTGAKLHYRYKIPLMSRFPIFGIILLILYVLLLISSSRISYLNVFLILGLLFIFMPLLQNLLLKKGIKKMPNFNKEVFWQFDEKAISGKGGGFEFKQDWTNMYEAIITTKGILVYPQEHVPFWVPKSAFKEQSDFEKVVDLVINSVKKSKRVK